MISVEFNNKTEILNVRVEGDITLEEIVDFMIVIENNEVYPRKLKVLMDARKASVKFKINGLSKIVKGNNRSLKNYNCFTEAIVLTTPKETALAMFYALISKTKNYKFKVFSTTESALYWLENY